MLTGLVLGLMGSFHCVGMCGPIALSLPLRGNTFAGKALGGILYNLGRTVTYGIMGALFGLIGQGFQLMGFQRWISIAMGALMIISILLPSLTKGLDWSRWIPFSGNVRKGIQQLFQRKSNAALFFIGLLNGLLPCGLVYMAVAGAIGIGDFYLGIGFMVLFGLGTLPMLLAVSLLGSLITISVRKRINQVIPYVVVIIGMLFVLRGLSLGIPYISPSQEKLYPEHHIHTNAEQVNPDGKANACCGSD